MNIGLIVDFLSQAGLPLIKAGIEEAWLEGRGELTDDQVCIFDKVQSISWSFLVPKNFWQYPKPKPSTQNSLQVAAIVEWELSVTPEQGGQLAEQASVEFFLFFVFVFVLSPEQGGQIAGKYESHYWTG